MAARSSKVILHEKWREKIRASMLINRLRNHVLGRLEMSNTQLRAAEILLSKVMPNLQATDITALDSEGRDLAIALIAYAPTNDTLQLPAPTLPATDTAGPGQRH
jgi:hypothetical protein